MTRGDIYQRNINISQVSEASFLGDTNGLSSGYSVSKAGDVNGDGYDDFLIGAPGEGGSISLFFGKSSGLSMDTNISDADVTFLGEGSMDGVGSSIAGAGDVNGDGYDDILIGAQTNSEGDVRAGQSYLMLGKANGWKRIITLSEADASFIGENREDYSGKSVSGAGDVNRDGFDDILIAAPWNDEGSNTAGQVYLILGKEDGWNMDQSLSDVDASFIGKQFDLYMTSEEGIAGAGDLNGDGYDDILIGAPNNNETGLQAGKVYIIFGKSQGWKMDTKLSEADASFRGEGPYLGAGDQVSGAGDVNGDGFNDILIGRWGGAQGGKSYLIFGKNSGWGVNKSLLNADVSFIGENVQSAHWNSISGAGDVDYDGYDDILIGMRLADYWGEEDIGKSYLILGKADGWTKNVWLSNADGSFIGEYAGDESGSSVAIAGDIDGDGFDDILVGAHYNDEGASKAGQTYLIMGYGITEPDEVYSLKTYYNESYSLEIDSAEINDDIYIELVGQDGNDQKTDNVQINITNNSNSSFYFPTSLHETGDNTGIYRGKIRFSNVTEVRSRSIKVSNGDVIKISSQSDPSTFVLIGVNAPVALKPLLDVTSIVEDEDYLVHYWNIGYHEVTRWEFGTNSAWLAWDEENHDLMGTPDNGDVGKWWVRINITDGQNNYDEHNFTIEVLNSPPNITTEDFSEAKENDLYHVDYNCTDDGQGTVTWSLTTTMDWLQIDPETGILSGVPLYYDIGRKSITIEVNDGNGGRDQTNFEINVIEANKPPEITSMDITTGTQEELYYRDYEANDPNEIDNDLLQWNLETNASFLSITNDTGELFGTPTLYDVGIFYINVTVSDPGGLMDSHIFNLTILNVNDEPQWIDVPSDVQVVHGTSYFFNVNAIDPDPGTILYYSITSSPESDIEIYPDSGEINWIASITWFDEEPFFMEITIQASDGEYSISHVFRITVLPTGSPTTMIIGPENRERTSSQSIMLSWKGEDPENEVITYDIYLHQTQAFVQGRKEEALHERDYDGENITLTSLEQGEIYFWTVIPKDGCSFGTCTSGVRLFRVNNRPTFNEMENHEVSVGKNFEYKISCNDEDQDDVLNLKYSLITAPDGMTINDDTGLIRWIPKNDQVMLHTVAVQVTDGIENNTATFEIEVKEKESPLSSAHLIVIISVIAAILIAIGIFFLIILKRKMDEKAQQREEEEKAALEKEREEEYASYEELYGISAPIEEEEDEEITTEELRDSIHEQIEKLEQMETEE